MFEVIISMVRTGRVRRRFFDTREEADRFAEERRDAWLNPKQTKARRIESRSARDIRIEVLSRDLPAIRQLQLAAAVQAVA
jgi:hypothetical protein